MNAFLATLTEEQRSGIAFPYPTGQTTATPADFSGRLGEQYGDSVWSNYPISDVIRPGLKIGDLTEDQHTAALAFLSVALGPSGYQKFADITNADQVLADSGTNYAAGTANYVVGVSAHRRRPSGGCGSLAGTTWGSPRPSRERP